MKIQITIRDLERIISGTKILMRNNSSLSDTIELELIKETDTHTGSDIISANIKNSYAECYSSPIMFK